MKKSLLLLLVALLVLSAGVASFAIEDHGQCIYCNKRGSLERTGVEHRWIDDGYIPKGVLCYFCDYTAGSNHLTQRKARIGTYKCNNCGKKFTSEIEGIGRRCLENGRVIYIDE